MFNQNFGASVACVHGPSAAYTFTNTEASDFVARATTPPSDLMKSYLDTFWTEIKAGPISGTNFLSKVDSFGFGFIDSEIATFNAKSASYGTVVPTNSPSYVTDQGYQGNASPARYLSMGIAMNRSGNVYVRDSACLGAWQLNNHATNSPILGVSANGIDLQPKTGSNNLSGRLNGFGAAVSIAMTDARGWCSINRSGGSAEQLYKNGVQQATGTGASSGVGTSTLLGLTNTTGFPAAHIMGGWWMGSSLTVDEHKDLYNAFRNLMVSAGVIVAGDYPVAS